MRDLLLLAGVIAICVYGYFVMDRLDRFLAHNSHVLAIPQRSGGERLYIGFSQPLSANGLSELLEQYSLKYPDVSVTLFTGSNEELIKKLSQDELDLIFLPESIENPSKAHYDSRRILLHCAPLVTSRGGLPIEPISEAAMPQHIFCRRTPKSPSVRRFIECLQTWISGQSELTQNTFK